MLAGIASASRAALIEILKSQRAGKSVHLSRAVRLVALIATWSGLSCAEREWALTVRAASAAVSSRAFIRSSCSFFVAGTRDLR